MGADKVLYCQACGKTLPLAEQGSRCTGCGSSNLGQNPKRHTLVRGYELSESDVTFLRTQGIKAEDSY